MNDAELDKFCACIDELDSAIDRLIQKTEHPTPEYVTKDSIFDIVFGEFCACSDETEQVLNSIIEQVRALPAEPVGPMPVA